MMEDKQTAPTNEGQTAPAVKQVLAYFDRYRPGAKQKAAETGKPEDAKPEA